MNYTFLVYTNTCGERPARTLDEAKNIAALMQADAPGFDQPRIFEWLSGCAGSDCECGGQIHPRSVELHHER